MESPDNNKWCKAGRHDARLSYYPLWATLIAAEQFYDARLYAAGWYEITGYDLTTWYDNSSDAGH